MTETTRKRGFLLSLAAEGMAPAIGGCAGVMAAGPVGGAAGVVVGQVVEHAINYFGKHIVERWAAWLRGQPRAIQQQAVCDLAELPPSKARAEAAAAVEQVAPDAAPEDKAVAVEYLAAIPRSVQRSLVPDPATSGMTLARGQLPDNPHTLLSLLPADVPPYPPGSALSGTPYQLGELVGTGGFGAVYKATAPSLQHLTFALKFCLDRSMAAILFHERQNLERLLEAGQGRWTDRIVRLYGYDLDHPTPFLVYEYVPGGDLATFLNVFRQQTGHALTADEVWGLVKQIAEALAFAHARGLVHRDLKPANVLVSGEAVKLADFGIGAVVASHAVQHSRIGSSVVDQLTSAEQLSLLRGAGTPLYMSPEQRRGEPPDPRHDLYSLGVLWYQLLAGDVTRELHPGWARELTARHNAPERHVALIERCVGWFDDRPRDAGELLSLMQSSASPAPPVPQPAPTVVKPEEVRGERLRKQKLLLDLKRLHLGLTEHERVERRSRTIGRSEIVGGLFLVAASAWLIFGGVTAGGLALLLLFLFGAVVVLSFLFRR